VAVVPPCCLEKVEQVLAAVEDRTADDVVPAGAGTDSSPIN
jgi:hypothetical protein